MVIGGGVIADRFADYSSRPQYLFFVGHVNDSLIQDGQIIRAEERAIKNSLSNYPDAIYVYFSSCSILDPEMISSAYVQHKIRMEELIKSMAQRFLIFRLPQIMGLTDTKTSLINYLVDAISNQKPFELWAGAKRNFIDLEDAHTIIDEVLSKGELLNRIVNVASTRQTSVLNLVCDIETFVGLKAKYTIVNKGAGLDIDVSDIRPILQNKSIVFDDGYIRRALYKYFGKLATTKKLNESDF